MPLFALLVATFHQLFDFLSFTLPFFKQFFQGRLVLWELLPIDTVLQGLLLLLAQQAAHRQGG